MLVIKVMRIHEPVNSSSILGGYFSLNLGGGSTATQLTRPNPLTSAVTDSFTVNEGSQRREQINPDVLNQEKALGRVQSEHNRPHQVAVSLPNHLFLHLGHGDEAWATPNSPLGVVFRVSLVHVFEADDVMSLAFDHFDFICPSGKKRFLHSL